MKCVVQRIKYGKVFVENKVVGQSQKGLLVLCGFSNEDTKETINWVANRIVKMRIFPDENGKLNRSLLDINGQALIVSNFTLYANCKHGYRPDFSKAAKREISEPLYNYFVEQVKKYVKVGTGKFGEHMEMELYSDGPITVVIEK